ncbi:unnamed protein product [Didymodactylos carnosus]|uniref:HAT C-terminal dimerisation domain-containing protein n=1 Tax=Didymodactylos carnosus TaxID=1234261 RepID=A0A8S2F1T0_9BILA|nr:unnamed protein product [Didymodactylos carnosus]CAF4141372.1 unnamed protein product [Didymodactylos carnosus]
MPNEFSKEFKELAFREIDFAEKEKGDPTIPLNNVTDCFQAILGISKTSVFQLKKEMKESKEEQKEEESTLHSLRRTSSSAFASSSTTTLLPRATSPKQRSGRPKNYRCGTGTTANIRRHLANSHDDAAIKCIVRDSRPFNEFRRPGMKIFLEQATPGYRGPHSKTVRRRLVPLYLQKQHDLKHQLSIVDHIALTTDLWQSGRKHYFLCVTAHYVTHQFEVKGTILSFRQFYGRKFAKRIESHLIRILIKFGIQRKIISTTTDNGSDVRSATEKNAAFGLRIHCMAHGLNLSIQNALGLWPKKKKISTTIASTTTVSSESDDSGSENESVTDESHPNSSGKDESESDGEGESEGDELEQVSALFDPKVHDLMSQDDKLNAENFIKDDYKKRAKASSKSSSSSANTISSNDPGESATTPGQASKFDQFLNKCGVKTTISSGNTKNRHLTIQQQLSKLRLLLKDNHDFMSFWSEYSSSILDLSKLARKYMAIPATSAPSEQAFSIVNYVARKNRLSLSSKSIKYTMYLKDKL